MAERRSTALRDRDVSGRRAAAADQRHGAVHRGRRTGVARCVGRIAGIGLVVAGLAACVTKDEAKKLVEALQSAQPTRPDVLPVMLSRDVPVRYPPALYGKKAQGNVMLRIFIDSTGRVRPESTVVAETSGEAAFDSAAVAGVRDLHFSPAQRHGAPIAVSILFPIYFRHPQGAPVPGDSVLRRGADSVAARANAGVQPTGGRGRQPDSARR
jgi:TonB family protein